VLLLESMPFGSVSRSDSPYLIDFTCGCFECTLVASALVLADHFCAFLA
jgi:hypothetical protein